MMKLRPDLMGKEEVKLRSLLPAAKTRPYLCDFFLFVYLKNRKYAGHPLSRRDLEEYVLYRL
jgi:hypothetical protein